MSDLEVATLLQDQNFTQSVRKICDLGWNLNVMDTSVHIGTILILDVKR